MIMASEKTNTPIVTIIVPLYNQERWLNACLRSICAQTYHNLEIIVINDGSTDNSPAIAKKYSEKDCRIRVVDKPNEGVTKARRDGLRLASGEYVAFVDSDDMLPKSAITTLVEYMTTAGVDLVLGAITRKLGFFKQSYYEKHFSFPVHQVINQPKLFDDYFVGFYRNSVFPVSMCGRLYRKSILDQAFYDGALFDKELTKMGEDQYFNVTLFPYLKSMYCTDETVYIYRYGGTTNHFNPNFPQLFVSSEKRLRLLDKYNYSKGYAPLFAEYVACLYFHASRLISCKITDKDGVLAFFKQEVESREIIPRLQEYYAANGIPNKQIESLMSRDYEGMYECACELLKQRSCSFKTKIRHYLIKWMLRWS